MGIFTWLFRRREEALTVVVHRALLMKFKNYPLSWAELKSIDVYFGRDKIVFMSEAEYHQYISDVGSHKRAVLDADIVSVLPDGTVDIHTHLYGGE